MNILLLNDFAYVDGGASTVALSSARALAERGHRVILFAAVGPVAEELKNVPGLEVHCLGQHEIVADPNRLHAAVQGLWNSKSASAFREVLADLVPQHTVIHLHTWTKALSTSVVRAAVDRGFPIVLTLHDYFSACPTGGFFLYPTQSICHLRPMSAACIGTACDSRNYGHKLWRVGRQWMQQHLGRLPSGIADYISISDLSQEVLQPWLPAEARFHRVPNPISVPRQPPAQPADYPTFSFMGRLSPEKGGDLLAGCAARHDLSVRFIGDGSERSRLHTMAPKAEFTGWLAPEAARQILQSSRALVFPSLWYETQGLVVPEAAALGLPVVVADSSAAREWVEDGVTGLLFRHGDAEDLAAKLIYLRDHPAQAAKFGMAAYERYWKQPATMQQHCGQLEAVYRSMLERATHTDPAAPESQVLPQEGRQS